MTLDPGDVIATGTPSGVGMATGDYLEAGEVKAALDLVSALPEQQSLAFEVWIAKAGQRVEALQAFEALAARFSKNPADGKASR